MRTAALVFALGLGILACDDSGEGTNGSLTDCDLNFASPNNTLKGFGEGCAANNECAFNVCLMPGVAGNITNSVFGFCSRGCDCEDNVASQLPDDQSEELDCLYPSGFKDLHHVVVECGSVDECKSLDERWTECSNPSSGNARRVCQANPI